jgi:peroxiredoxin
MEKNSDLLSKELEGAKERFKANNSPEAAEMFRSFIDQLASEGVGGKARKVGETAPDFTLKNAVGHDVTLSHELKNGPVILTWYRGGWCPYCNLALNFLQRHLPQFKAYGAQLIAITPETPDQSMSTKEKNNLEFEVLTDENNKVAAMYAGVHGLPEHIREFYSNRGVGEHYNNYQNIEFPVPATYIIDQAGVVRFLSAESDYRKRAEPTEIVESLKRLRDN